MRRERWKDVVGYEGLYQVSDLGKILRVKQGGRKAKILRTSSRDTSGRMGAVLRKDGVARTQYVDRIVMAAWVGPIKAGQTVWHNRRGIADNSVENLSYGPRIGDHKRYRETCVKRSDGIVFISIAQAAAITGIDESGIRKVCNGEAKSAGGWSWERIE